MLFLWWLTMYRHMKAYIHHPYSIMHIGIGSWLGSYVFLLTDYVLTYLDHPYSITHIILYIYIGSWLGSCDVFMVTDHMYIYIYIYIHKYMYMYISYICIYIFPIPNTKKKNTTSKDPVFAKSSTLFCPFVHLVNVLMSYQDHQGCVYPISKNGLRSV